jgi:hypothetical protein
MIAGFWLVVAAAFIAGCAMLWEWTVRTVSARIETLIREDDRRHGG